MAYTEQELMRALRNADKAGDTKAAKRFASMIQQKRAEAQTATPEQTDTGVMGTIKDMITGESKATRATEELPELVGSTGFLSTEDPAQVAKVAAVLTTTTEPQEMANILQKNFPNIGIQYDEKGNIIAANNETGQRVVLNRPGMSGQDALNMLGLGLLSAPAAAAGSIPAVMAATGGTAVATEAAQAVEGGEFNPENVIVDTLTAGFMDALPAMFKRYKSRTDAQATEAAADAAAAEAARVGDELSPEVQALQQRKAISDIGEQAYKKTPDFKDVATDVSIDPEISAAAERLDLADTLTPGQMSASQTYREIEGGVGAIAGTTLSAQQKKAMEETAQKADDLIMDFGGTLDKAALSDKIRVDFKKTIDGLYDEAEDIYDGITARIAPGTEIDASSLLKYLDNQSVIMKGRQFLEPVQKRLYDVAEANPSYALIDKERKKIGQAIEQKSGPYHKEEVGTLKLLYSKLSEVQEAAANEHGMGPAWQLAKEKVNKRKQLENASIKVLGRELTGSIIPRLGSGMVKLQSGDTKIFDDIMKALPPDQRQEAMITALNDVFTAGGRSQDQLSAPGFVTWYEKVDRQPAAKNRILKYLPEGAAERLDDIYLVSKGIRNLSRESKSTGVIRGLMKEYDNADSWVSKIYQTGSQVAAAEGATSTMGAPGVGTVGVVASTLSKGKRDPLTNAADDLLSSAEFRKAVASYGDKTSRARAKQAVAEKALLKSKKLQRWVDALPDEKKREVIRQISRGGLISWLGGGEESEFEN